MEIEPLSRTYQVRVLPLNHIGLAGDERFELSVSALEADGLPLTESPILSGIVINHFRARYENRTRLASLEN